MSWVVALEPVHVTRGRGRWRFQCVAGTPMDERSLTQAIENLPGVRSVRINRVVRSLIVAFDARRTDHATIETGLLALSPPPEAVVSRRLVRAETGNSPARVFGTLLAAALTQVLPLGLKLPVTLAASLPVLRHGFTDVIQNGISSHGLEALAVTISVMRRDYLAANTTNFMLSLGEYLEDSIARHSDQLLKHLLVPVGTEVWVERNGAEQLVAAEEIQVGDTVIVATGAIIPVDGTVLGGEGFVNESAMTGESAPVSKARGDSVLSGTLVDDGRLRIYAEHVGPKTAAARIADYVEQSLNAKSNAQLEASRLADRLVPYVLGLAGVAYAGSGNWQRAAAVLQADYSCALKLATPVAFKSSMYEAGRHNILVKGSTALERLAEADTFIFDKTGTLTSGSLAVTDSLTFDTEFSADDIVWLAASVEEHYFHPLALAVVAAAKNNAQSCHFDHTEVEFVVAHGVASEVNGKRIVVGSRHFVEDDEEISIEAHRQSLEALYREGKTLLYIGYGGRLIGVLALKDSLRSNSVATIARLRSLGARRVLMLTGDHHDRAAELAEELGLDGFHAELLPDDKARLISELASEGARIAFIGDGINDAPALAGAHVGIAMQKGADISRLSADIALLEDNIARVADAKALALAAMRRIDNNYRMAVGLNTTILGAASAGLLSPITTSVLHNGSTLAILGNALRKHKVFDA